MDEIKSGNPYWVLLSIPIFFFVWWISDFGYALISGVGSLVILLVLFVWIPDDQARKINRKRKFLEARRLLETVSKQLRRIKDTKIKDENSKAILTFKGLIDTFELKKTVQGKVEEKVLPMLQNLSGLLLRWSNHESGEFPLEENEARKIRGVLLHFDDLILKYQNDGIDSTDTYLTGLYELETDMQSAGINPEGEKTNG